MWFAYNCCINFCQFSPFMYRLCEHIQYYTNTLPIAEVDVAPVPPPLPTPSKIVTFSALETSHSLACTFYEFVKVCRCFYATNENIHVLSMKFPHLFLRPEIIIIFCGDGSGVGAGATPLSAEFWFKHNLRFCIYMRRLVMILIKTSLNFLYLHEKISYDPH